MPIDYSIYPPNWKTEIRPRILKREKNCCKWCKVPNGAEIWRDKKGQWHHVAEFVYAHATYSSSQLDAEYPGWDEMPDFTKPIKIVLGYGNHPHICFNADSRCYRENGFEVC